MTLTRMDPPDSQKHLERVRTICQRLAGTTEKVSHGEPTFFVNKRVYCSFSNNHHDDGLVAVWIAAAPGMQGMLLRENPDKFYLPPYVGVRGWIGVDLEEVDEDELDSLVQAAWSLIASRKR